MATLLPKHHLSRHPVDDEIARRVLTNLIESLDANRELLTRAEVDQFRRTAEAIDDQLRRGDLATVSQLFEKVLERAERRHAAIEELLEADHDFTVDENMLADPNTADFVDDEVALRERWRKRVKYQLLQHLAAGVVPDAARRPAGRHFLGIIEAHRAIGGDQVVSRTLDALARAYDPHSAYISARDVEDFLIQQRQRLVGIGASLRAEDGYIRVIEVIAGGPADRDGRLKPGDRLLAVGEGADGEMVDVVGAPLKDVVSRIRGAKGTTVRLRVLPEGRFEAQQHELTREVVQTLKARGVVLTGDPLPADRSARLGYIHLPSFYGAAQETAAGDIHTAGGDVRRLLEGFRREKVELAILDLRDNGGGTLTEALNVAGLFLGDVPVVQVKDSEGKIAVQGATGTTRAWNKPVVLLTNRVSAAATEILVGAIQDHRRGLVIGDGTTVGFGTVQTLLDIGQQTAGGGSPPKLGSLRVTTQRFYRPGGRSTQLIGIAPDVVLPSPGDATESGERTHRYHLDTDTIAGAEFQPRDFGIDEALVKQLTARSEARRESSPYFRDLRERIERLTQRQAAGVVTLNREKYLASRADLGASGDAPDVPGLPGVKVDGSLAEVFAIALDYLGRRALALGEGAFGRSQWSEATRHLRAAVAADPELAVATTGSAGCWPPRPRGRCATVAWPLPIAAGRASWAAPPGGNMSWPCAGRGGGRRLRPGPEGPGNRPGTGPHEGEGRLVLPGKPLRNPSVLPVTVTCP